MSKMIQIRNVPDDLHRRLKARAAMIGKTLSDFLFSEVEKLVDHPTPAELRDRLAARLPVSVLPIQNLRQKGRSPSGRRPGRPGRETDHESP